MRSAAAPACADRADRRDIPVAIIGAGPSGLAVAAELGRRGVAATVFESSGHVAASWRGHYDHLRLHTVRGLSALPGMRIPRGFGRWVARDDMVRYLEDYARHHDLDVRLSTPVDRIRPVERDGVVDAWRLCTGSTTATAGTVVVATGLNRTPHLPTWPGQDTFAGSVIHSADYRAPEPYEGRSVLVVGAGNSGAEIAVALTRRGAARVWWAVRTPPNIVPASSDRLQRLGIAVGALPTSVADLLTTAFERSFLPNLTAHGLPRAREGLYTRARRDEVSPVHDRGVVAAVRRERVRPVAAVAEFDQGQVVLADGTRIRPDDVVAATGYRCGLERLVGPDVLTSRGAPLARGARTAPGTPNLHFVGFTNHPSGHLRFAGLEARATAKAISRRLRRCGDRPVEHAPDCACAPERVSEEVA
ncbi:NAD(P)/FAD-dependent oxidoreductase [Saccharopolyspora gloriosae]|uniref:Cation diffusion facilitator CzcD-associated flavoprotein CzcO n=1 Tax=Saccharopolyspora gloriosae TaxID=455344 RepID=A0A840NNW9_9PSEU|nr:cation diffusion facilitator CzcD-associated flavoprotein CzcO [Saccharopolyspora gloriosae]